MSEQSNLRFGVVGLVALVLVGTGGWMLTKSGKAPVPSAVQEVRPIEPIDTLTSLSKIGDAAPSRRQMDIQQWKTPQGTPVLFVAAPELPMFDLRVIFSAGSSQDGEQEGIAYLTNALLNEGIEGADATAIAARFEDLGAQFGASSHRDMALVSLRSLSTEAQREPAVELFTEVVSEPTFPNEALSRIRNQLLASFEMRKKNPGQLAGIELFEQLYGSHPYAHSSSGDPQSIGSLKQSDLRAFHNKAYTAPNAVIALVGDLTREQAEAIAEKVSAALPDGPALASVAQPEAVAGGTHTIVFPSQQTHLQIAQLGVAQGDPDYPALYVANQILGGGGFGTRLMEEVREKRGLTYGIYSGFSPMRATGPFMINVQTRAELADATQALTLQLVKDFIEQGPTQAEVDRVKRELAGSYPLSTASNGQIAGQLGSIAFYGLPLTQMDDFMDAVQKLSVDDVKQAMARHINPDEFVIVRVGPEVEQLPLPPANNEAAPEPTTAPTEGQK